MIRTILIFGFAVFPFICGCTEGTPPSPDPIKDSIPKDTVAYASYNTDTLPFSDQFRITQTQLLKTDSLREISGLVASKEYANDYWGEEDSGNKNAIYLIDSSGRWIGTKYLANVFNRDWEDMAGGPGPVEGKYYLYVGDIGDNLLILPFITVYRFEEPKDMKYETDSLISNYDVINLVYPDGRHNAEALMVDPQTKDIYVITKGDSAGLYRVAYPQNTTSITPLTLLEVLPISTVTAADISPDGTQILIKNYDDVFYWKRKAGETIEACLSRVPIRLKYKKELQGEAIAWTRYGDGFYTLSEMVGNHVPVFYHYESF